MWKIFPAYQLDGGRAEENGHDLTRVNSAHLLWSCVRTAVCPAGKIFARARSGLLHEGSGQSLLEVTLLLPLLIIVVLNAVNIGYIFSIYLNLTTAPRQAVEYSIRGTTSTLQLTMPGPDSVNSLLYDNIAGAIPGAGSTPTRICTLALGLTGSGAAQVPNCTTYGTGTGTFSNLQADPEAPNFVLQRVDVQYTVTPLIQGAVFNLLPDSITLHKSVMMRAMP